jgi:hypothetical protein
MNQSLPTAPHLLRLACGAPAHIVLASTKGKLVAINFSSVIAYPPLPRLELVPDIPVPLRARHHSMIVCTGRTHCQCNSRPQERTQQAELQEHRCALVCLVGVRARAVDLVRPLTMGW